MNDTYTVLLREKKLPLSLLEDPEAKRESKQNRAALRSAHSFDSAFGKKQTRKRPKLSTDDYSQLLGEAADTNTRCGVQKYYLTGGECPFAAVIGLM